MKILDALLHTMRPYRWWRAAIVFIPFVFEGGAFNIFSILKMSVSFIVFCLVTGAINIIDDVVDKKTDRNDPLKATLPIASGELSESKAEFSVAAILLGSFVAAFFFGPVFGAIVIAYFLIETAYYLYLKNEPFIDAVCIAVEMSLILLGGSIVSQRMISPWFFVFVLAVSVFIVLAEKKRAMLLALAVKPAGESPKENGLLEQGLTISAACAILIYCFYALSSLEGIKYGMILTTPLVFYAVFRVLMLTYDNGSEKALEKKLLGDGRFLVTVILWVVAAAVLSVI